MQTRTGIWAAPCLAIAMLIAPARADLVAYYNFNDEIEDISGNGNNPTQIFHGTFIADVPTQIGSGTAFNMEGGPGGFSVADSATLDIESAVSVSAWVNMSDAATYYFVAVKGPSGAASNNYPGNYEFRLNPAGQPEFVHQTSQGNTASFYQGTSSVPVIEWHHIAVTASAGGDVSFYIDGLPAGSSPQLGAFGIVNDIPLLVGTRTDEYSHFNGWMDDLTIWNQVLNPDQISQLAAGADPLTLLGDFSADINSDGSVDIDDYIILRDHFGQAGSFEDGDLDANGRIDGQDFRLLKDAFAGAPASVPEPASWLLASIAGLAILAVRRRAALLLVVGAIAGLATAARADVVLSVNPFTGATSIRNETGAALGLDNYAIRSRINGIDAAEWTSLTTSGVAGVGWEEAPSSDNFIGELRWEGAHTLNNGASVSLGSPYRTGGYRDLSLEVVPVGSEDFAPVTVEYVGSPTPGQEYRVQNVTIAEVSSQLGAPFNRPATYMLDGSGINVAAGSHTIAPDGFMWLTAGVGFTAGVDDFSPYVIFDLGESTDLANMRVWNYNEDLEGRPELLGRGVDLFEVSVASDLAGPYVSLGNLSLDKAPGLGDVDFSEVIPLDADDVRFVRFDIQSNHNGVVYPAVGGEPDAAFAGLSEIQFYGLAGSSARLGDTDNDGDVDLDDLNNVRNFFGTDDVTGDADHDGDTDLDDLNAVRNFFGSPAGSTTPEPSACGLALLAALGAIGLRRWR